MEEVKTYLSSLLVEFCNLSLPALSMSIHFAAIAPVLSKARNTYIIILFEVELTEMMYDQCK